MDFLFRAWKQNIRKPMKSLMIFLVMFVISNLIVTGIFILKGTEKATNATLSQMTPIIYYTQDYDRYWRAQELGFVDSETDPMPNISLETALEIGRSNDVEAFDLSTQSTALIRSIKAYKDPNSQGGGNWITSTDSEGNTETFQEPDYYEMLGSSSSEFKVASGTIEIVDGRGINEDDVANSNYVLVIEENLAKANNLSVGDTLPVDFKMVWDAEEAALPSTTENDFEIVGIYRNLSA
ncbi:MAG: ABC transporter permease, partial [Turicibacter sanguinis]|nr:ABC transporter permease [Turicibacter sanguinis]